jgi:FSR family fosmidomycin resistance protein-like MFS transporter
VPHGTPAASAGADVRSSGAALARGAREALRALRRRAVVRWLVLLELSNLMLDVLHGFLALYVVDVAGASGWWAGMAIVVWAGAGLAGDALLIPLLRRVSGVRWLHGSALAALVVYPAFLLVPALGAKLALLGVLALLRAGWYAILKGRLYGAMPGRSATVLAVANVAGLVGSLLPLALGLAAERWGLGTAMWLLLAAPAALVVGLPRDAVRLDA